MAFQQAPVGFQAITSTTLDALPSLSSVLTLPWRTLGRSPSSQSKTQQASVKERRSEAAKSANKVSTKTEIPQALRDIPTGRLAFAPAPAVLGAHYGVRSLFSSGISSSKAPVSKLSGISGSSRFFSTATRIGPFQLRALPRHHTLNFVQFRTAVVGATSHNLLAHMEQTANNNPSSATAQNAFYSALLRASMPEIVVERYETGRYATNAACDAMYARALERTGQAETSMMGATPIQRNGLNQSQLNSVSRAVVANSRGGASASSRIKGGPAETGAKDSPLHVVIDESMSMTVFRWGKFIVGYGLVGYFILVVLSIAIEASGIMKKVGGTQNSEIKAEQQKARFSDVQGCDEAKEELQEVVEFLKNPERFNQLGGKLPKGVLMIGPPGTGKTLLARAVAGEAGVPFFYMSGSEFDEVYVGVGAKRVRELFGAARAKAPAIIFIDELDAVGGKRNARDAAYHMQTLNQLLTDLDGFDQSTGVVFLAATNFPEMLDKALTRPGRFDRQIHVPLPDVRGRIAILDFHMKNMLVGADIDTSVIARGTPGFSGADLENLVNQGAVHASKIGATAISMSDLEWAKDRILMGAEKRSAVIQQKDKVNTAYHEAGHALVALYNPNADPLYKCTIMPRGAALGVTSYMPELDKVSMTKAEYMAWIDISMGGKIAEEILSGPENVSSGCSSDLSKATQIAYGMVTQYGMSEALGAIAYEDSLYKTLSSETKQKIEDEVRRFLNEGQERARKVLISRRKELDLLAKALLDYETLNKDEIEKVIKGEKLPEKTKSLPNAPIKLPEIKLPVPLRGEPGSDEPPPQPVAAKS